MPGSDSSTFTVELPCRNVIPIRVNNARHGQELWLQATIRDNRLSLMETESRCQTKTSECCRPKARSTPQAAERKPITCGFCSGRGHSQRYCKEKKHRVLFHLALLNDTKHGTYEQLIPALNEIANFTLEADRVGLLPPQSSFPCAWQGTLYPFGCLVTMGLFTNTL